MSFKLVNATSSSSRIFFSLCLSLFWQRRNDGARTQTSAPRGAICNADARNESKRELKRLLFFHPSSLRTHHKKANKRRQKERENETSMCVRTNFFAFRRIRSSIPRTRCVCASLLLCVVTPGRENSFEIASSSVSLERCSERAFSRFARDIFFY